MSYEVKYSDLVNLRPFIRQGSGSSRMFEAVLDGEDVLVKVQVMNEGLRFPQEKEVLELQLDGVVGLIAYGSDIQGHPFLVIEKLDPLPEKISLDQLKHVVYTYLCTVRELYVNGVLWPALSKHCMIDTNGHPKIIDFNDDRVDGWLPFIGEKMAVVNNGFFNCKSFTEHDLKWYTGFSHTMMEICNQRGYNWRKIMDESIAKMITEEYQSLENVHQPIFFDPLQNTLRTETEKNDPDFGKLVSTSRKCSDRANLMLQHMKFDLNGATYLDIGCNVGWFPFYFNREWGMDTTGMDASVPMINFANTLAEIHEVPVSFDASNFNMEYVKSMESYDVVSALSMLHWLVSSPPPGSVQISDTRSKDEVEETLRVLGSKVNKMFFVETSPTIFSKLDVVGFDGLAEFIADVGRFSSWEIIGKSDTGRPLIKLEK